ncbi:MAG: hypothetical protein Q7S29_05395 [Candidatus Peribacter sp.]|nr:hypothetical protein [Candidatus Peribacter sp.]
MQFDSAIIGLASGILGSILTLIVGIRVGKNQVDRPELQKTYISLRQHFQKMLTNLEEGFPSVWSDFKKWGKLDPKPSPSVFGGREEGKLLILQESLLDELEAIEKEALDLGGEMHRLGDSMWGYASGEIRKMGIQNISIINNGEYVQVGPKNIPSHQMFEFPFLALFFKNEQSAELLDSMKFRDDVGVHLAMKYSKNFEIFPKALDSAGISILGFLKKLMQFAEAQSKYPILAERKLKNELQIAQVIRKLEGLARDPHPLWETIKLSAIDVFRS